VFGHGHIICGDIYILLCSSYWKLSLCNAHTLNCMNHSSSSSINTFKSMVRLGERKAPAMGYVETPPVPQVDRSVRRRSSSSVEDRGHHHQVPKQNKEPHRPSSRDSSRRMIVPVDSSEITGNGKLSNSNNREHPPQEIFRPRKPPSERRPSIRPSPTTPPPPSLPAKDDFRQCRAYAAATAAAASAAECDYPNDSKEYGHELVRTSSKYAPPSYVSDNRGPEGPPNQTQPARIPSEQRKLSREVSMKKMASAVELCQVPQEEESGYKSTKSQVRIHT